MNIRQDFRCSDEPEAEPAVAPSNLSQSDLNALEPAIREQTEAFLTAMDEADWASAYQMADSAMHGGQTLQAWSQSQGPADPALGREIVRVTWYQNPQGQPAGLYGAVDIRARYSTGSECGYVVWYRAAPDQTFRATGLHRNRIPDDVDPTIAAQMRAAYCPEG